MRETVRTDEEIRLRATTRLKCGLALVIAFVVGGCGSSGSDKTAAVHVSKAVFLRKADVTCERIYDQVTAGYQSFVKHAGNQPFSTPQKIRSFVNTVLLPAKRQEVDELRALGVPGGDEDQVEGILAAYEEGIATAEEDPQAAATSTFGVFVLATEMAEAYGLEDCHY